jgi:hypothetical protein
MGEVNMRTLKFRVYIPEHGKFTYFGINGFDHSDRYLDQTGYPVQQFIELYDVHGKEIYEGDILKRKGNYYIYVVVYSPEYSCYQLKDLDGDYVSVAYHKDKLEVIGNICEHPEILKV